MTWKYIKKLSLTSAILLAGLNYLFVPSASAASFNPSYIMNDSVFGDSNSMNAAQIDAFLNGFSTSCISPNKGFKAPSLTGYSPSTGFTYGGAVTAGNIIDTAAQVYGLSPKVILVTLQKEQSLVTGGGGICSDPFSATAKKRYTGAMGYNCPDGGSSYNYSGFELYRINSTVVSSVTGTCVNRAQSAGFSRQVVVATWKLKFNEQRSKGNVAWDVQKPGWDNSDDPPTCYNGYMTPGNRARALNSGTSCDQTFFYDGRYTIDTTAVTMNSGATASLYYYTPHISGNTNFFNIFVSWFGNPAIACTGTSNLSGTPSGPKTMGFNYGSTSLTNLTYIQVNNTGSTCVEAHIWKPGFTSWLTNIATGMNASDPSLGTLVSNKATIDNRESLTYILYSGSGGRVEIHRFSPDLQTFPGYYDVATNLSGVSASTGTFVAGDFLGRGYDQLAYILYSGAGGRAEVHMFDPTLRTAVGYYDVATNLSGVSASTGTFVAGDFLGRGYNQLAYVTYGSTTVHLLDIRNGRAVRIYEVPTNLSSVSASTGTFVAGDFLGRGYGQLVYVIYNNSVNKVETHMFNPSLTQSTGFQDIITNLGGFDPSG